MFLIFKGRKYENCRYPIKIFQEVPDAELQSLVCVSGKLGMEIVFSFFDAFLPHAKKLFLQNECGFMNVHFSFVESTAEVIGMVYTLCISRSVRLADGLSSTLRQGTFVELKIHVLVKEKNKKSCPFPSSGSLRDVS